MNKENFIKILDKNIDQEGLLKDLGTELLKPVIISFKNKIESGEIDIVKGTDIDKLMIIKALDLILEKI